MKRHDSNRNLQPSQPSYAYFPPLHSKTVSGISRIFYISFTRNLVLLLKTKISFLRENKLPAEVSKDNGFLRIAQQIDFMPAN